MSDNVISLPPRATPLEQDNERVLAERQRQADALEIARLSILDHVEYERARIEAAKKLGVRISFLDKTVERIRERIRNFEADHVVAAPEGLKGVTFHHDDGRVTAASFFGEAAITRPANGTSKLIAMTRRLAALSI